MPREFNIHEEKFLDYELKFIFSAFNLSLTGDENDAECITKLLIQKSLQTQNKPRKKGMNGVLKLYVLTTAFIYISKTKLTSLK